MKTNLKCIERRVGVLELNGALVSAGDRRILERRLERASAQGIRSLVVDLQGATMVSGAGVGLLLFIRKIWIARGGSIRLAGPCGRACSLISVSRLGNHFPWHRSVEEAVAAFLADEECQPRAPAAYSQPRAAVAYVLPRVASPCSLRYAEARRSAVVEP